MKAGSQSTVYIEWCTAEWQHEHQPEVNLHAKETEVTFVQRQEML